MAKLDEITALLTEELDGFKKSIQKLETVVEEMYSYSVKKKISSIEEKVSHQEKCQTKHFQNQRVEINALAKKIKYSKMTPKWLLVLFLSASILSILTIWLAIYQLKEVKAKQVEAYMQGVENTTSNIRPFFNQHPEAYAKYEKWRKELAQESQSKK